MTAAGRRVLWLLVAAGAPAQVRADPVPVVGREARKGLELTVYTQDVALVKDTREVPIPSGEQLLRFEDVAARIDPSTVTVRSLTEQDRLALLEQTVAVDAISPDALLARSIGKEVDLVETDVKLRTRVTPATLLGTTGGLVFRVGDQVVINPPGRVVLHELPEGLGVRPSLLWRLLNTGPDWHRLEVAYLTAGLSWTADYVATLNDDDSVLDLTVWATITNQSGARYDDATVALVAGQLHRVSPTPRPMAGETMMFRAAAAPAPTEETFSEYHLYTLPSRATLGDREAKQIELLRTAGVPVQRKLTAIGQAAWLRSPQGDLAQQLPVTASVELVNDPAHRLGLPLPAGTVRLYQRDPSKSLRLVGEDRLPDTPGDGKARLTLGNAFDVQATRRQTEFRSVSVKPYDHEVAVALTLRNGGAQAVTVDVREPMVGEWKLVESSVPATPVDAGTLGFTTDVPAKGETTITYRVQVGSGRS